MSLALLVAAVARVTLAALRGGKSVVHLRSTARGHRPCQTKQWMHTVANAVTRNFDCSYYYTAHASAPPRTERLR